MSHDVIIDGENPSPLDQPHEADMEWPQTFNLAIGLGFESPRVDYKSGALYSHTQTGKGSDCKPDMCEFESR